MFLRVVSCLNDCQPMTLQVSGCEAILLDSTNLKYFCDRGNIYAILNIHDSALYNYDHALSINPNDCYTLSNLGVLR